MAEASPNSMSAAAQAYQESMEKYGQREQSAPALTPAPAAAPALSTTAAPALSTTPAPALSTTTAPALATPAAPAEDTPMTDAAVCTASIAHRIPARPYTHV